MEALNNNDPYLFEGRKCLLVFGYDDKQVIKLKDLYNKMNITDIIVIEKNMINNTVEDIINDTYKKEIAKTIVPAKVILINGFSNNEVNQIVDIFKESQLIKPIFAVVTGTSKNWIFSKLTNELIMEKILLNKNKIKH